MANNKNGNKFSMVITYLCVIAFLAFLVYGAVALCSCGIATEKITVGLMVDDGTSSRNYGVIEVDEGSSALDALLSFENSFFTFEYEDGPYGAYITEVNGVVQGTDGAYWMFYVNGVQPEVGVSNYELAHGDIIQLNLEVYTG